MTAIGHITPELSTHADAAPLAPQMAIVSAITPGGIMITRNGIPALAKVALSCLVQPEPGDTVLTMAAGELWIIAIATRANAAPLRLLTQGDAIIGAPDHALSLNAGQLTVQAAKADFFIGQILHAGQAITAHVTKLNLIGGLFETIAERVTLMAKRSQRIIEESDQTRARNIEQTAQATLHLQADNAFLTGGTVIRMDASQIHMG